MMKSFSVLQTELDDAKSTLKTFDNDIKRLIGRDPSELPSRPPPKRNNFTQVEERGRPRNFVGQNDEKRFKNSRLRMVVHENEEPLAKKRNMGVSVFKRLSDRPVHDDFQSKQLKGMISKVIVTPKEIPSRQERMEAQSKDEIVVARNRRMFGSLLGTLQKFQQEQTKLKTKEDKRAQLEKKIEEHEIKEKEEIKKERQELFLNRKKKQAEIKMIELKMIRMREYAKWEESQRHRMHFIHTKAKPSIHFLPRRLKDVHKDLLENSKTEIQNLIDKKREQVEDELKLIEERGKRIFEPRKFHQENKEQEDNDDENGVDDDDDLHQEEKEMKQIEDENPPIIDNENRTDDETVQMKHETTDETVQMKHETTDEIINGTEMQNGEKLENSSQLVDESTEIISVNKFDDSIKVEEDTLINNISIENVQQGDIKSSINSAESYKSEHKLDVDSSTFE